MLDLAQWHTEVNPLQRQHHIRVLVRVPDAPLPILLPANALGKQPRMGVPALVGNLEEIPSSPLWTSLAPTVAAIMAVNQQAKDLCFSSPFQL